MNPEITEILNFFAKEHGWLFGKKHIKLRGFTTSNSLCFSKTFKGLYVPKWNKPMSPRGIIEVSWRKEHPTQMRLSHPVLVLTLEGEVYTESCSLRITSIFMQFIDLINPDSLDAIPPLFEQVDDDIDDFAQDDLKGLIGDCKSFQEKAGDMILVNPGSAGHDF